MLTHGYEAFINPMKFKTIYFKKGITKELEGHLFVKMRPKTLLQIKEENSRVPRVLDILMYYKEFGGSELQTKIFKFVNTNSNQWEKPQ